MVGHVLVDLHAEELRGDELSEFAVPRRAGVQAGVGAERPGRVLVHAHRDPEIVVAEADRVGRQRERARRSRAAVVDIGERDPGEAQERDDGVGVVDLVAPRERELDVTPGDPGVGERVADRDRAHLDAGRLAEAPERVQPHSDDRYVHVHSLSSVRPGVDQVTGRNAKVTTSLPSSSVRNGTTTSSISMPFVNTSGSHEVRRVSTFTSPGSST